jgi:hypothetical protein
MCKFTKEINRDDRLNFDCVCETVMWPGSQSKHCNSILEMSEILIKEKKERRFGFCKEDCFFVHHVSISKGILVKLCK